MILSSNKVLKYQMPNQAAPIYIKAVNVAIDDETGEKSYIDKYGSVWSEKYLIQEMSFK